MEDNPALYSISNFGQKIYAFFIYDEKKFKNRSAQQWWLYKTLVNFQNKLNNLGISFKIYAENEVQCIKKLIKSENIDKFYYNTIARPDELLIESEIEKNLTSHDINWKKFESNLLQDPFSVRKKDNTPFQVFTPYWRNAEEQYLKNKNFINNLVSNVSTTLNLIKSGKQTSIILNYDELSENLFKWYQQLIAESLGKKSLGLLPVVSSMPKDNHSLMQLYLDGPNKYFYTFFNVIENRNIKIKNDSVLNTHKFLKNLSIEKIKQSQMIATEKVFISKKIPFRSFRILKRNEQSLGELFCFFILETILLGRALNVNPFDQPSVELIKIETKKILS